MRIEIFPKTENTSLSHREVTFVIFYPQTEFIILSGRVTNRNARTYIKQAILKTYGGEKIDSQHHRGGIISQITSIIRTRKSQGVFAQLRHNQVDSNPLDIRQKAPVRLEHEQESASTSDLNRRLKAVDQDDINLRRKIVLENYGHSFATSTTSLKVAVS
jgi:ribosomal protein S24E